MIIITSIISAIIGGIVGFFTGVAFEGDVYQKLIVGNLTALIVAFVLSIILGLIAARFRDNSKEENET